jgi:hypothetical protein
MKLEVGSWKLEVGSWKLEVSSSEGQRGGRAERLGRRGVDGGGGAESGGDFVAVATVNGGEIKWEDAVEFL